MTALSVELRAAVAAHAPYTPTYSPATLRALAAQEGGNAQLAKRLGVTPRTVQRWTTETGTQKRAAVRSTPALRDAVADLVTTSRVKAGARALRGRPVTVEASRIMVVTYDQTRARPRSPGDQQLDADAMADVLDSLEDGDIGAASEAFTAAWLGAYGMDVDSSITDVAGSLRLS